MNDPRSETFLCVCEEMNFTRAAGKMNVTQPAVTQQIHSLEEYYGVPLFRFTGKRFCLTEYGELIRASLMSARNNERYLIERLEIMKSKHEFVNMGATLTVGEYMMTDFIAPYLKKHSSADISMCVENTSKLLEELDAGNIDFAVLEGNYSKSGYEHRLLFNCEFIGIASEAVIDTSPAYRLNDITGTRLLLREKGSGTRDIFEKALLPEQLSLHDFDNITTVGSMHAIIELAVRGCGITFLYKRAVKELLASGDVRQLNISGFPLDHEISAVWRKDNQQSRYIDSLVDELFVSINI